jgi:hypothetical protein
LDLYFGLIFGIVPVNLAAFAVLVFGSRSLIAKRGVATWLAICIGMVGGAAWSAFIVGSSLKYPGWISTDVELVCTIIGTTLVIFLSYHVYQVKGATAHKLEGARTYYLGTFLLLWMSSVFLAACVPLGDHYSGLFDIMSITGYFFMLFGGPAFGLSCLGAFLFGLHLLFPEKFFTKRSIATSAMVGGILVINYLLFVFDGGAIVIFLPDRSLPTVLNFVLVLAPSIVTTLIVGYLASRVYPNFEA